MEYPNETTKKYTGEVASFDDTTGIGSIKHITKNNQNEYLRFDYKAILNELKTARKGQIVSFNIDYYDNEKYAIKVRIIKNIILYYGEIYNYKNNIGYIKYVDINDNNTKSIKFNKNVLKNCINKSGTWENIKNKERVIFEIKKYKNGGLNALNIKRDFTFNERKINHDKRLKNHMPMSMKIKLNKLNEHEKSELKKKWNINKNDADKMIYEVIKDIFKNGGTHKIRDINKRLLYEYKHHMTFIFKRNNGKRNITTYIKYEFDGLRCYLESKNEFIIDMNYVTLIDDNITNILKSMEQDETIPDVETKNPDNEPVNDAPGEPGEAGETEEETKISPTDDNKPKAKVNKTKLTTWSEITKKDEIKNTNNNNDNNNSNTNNNDTNNDTINDTTNNTTNDAYNDTNNDNNSNNNNNNNNNNKNNKNNNENNDMNKKVGKNEGTKKKRRRRRSKKNKQNKSQH